MIKSRRFKRDKRCYPNTLVNLRASYHFKKPLREIRKLFKGEKFLDEAMWQLNMSSIGAPKLTEVKRSLSALMPGVSCMQCGYPFYIVVPDGNQYEDNELLLRTLVAKVYPLPLMPFMWSAAGPVVTFFTDSQEAAFALDRLNGQIEMPDGLKLMIWVCQSPVELVNLPGYLFRLSKVLKQLYCPFDNKLDLSSFHRNPALGNFYFPLSSAGCRQILANIVCDKYPDVQRINLAGNRLGSVCKLEEFTQRLPKLSALHLGHNELPNIEALDNLHLLPLVELCLDENLSRPYPNREAYHWAKYRTD